MIRAVALGLAASAWLSARPSFAAELSLTSEEPGRVLLERYSGVVDYRGYRDVWQLVCPLPCSTLDRPEGLYRLRAPALRTAPLALGTPLPERVWVEVLHERSYGRVWLGWSLLGLGLAGAALSFDWAAGGLVSGHPCACATPGQRQDGLERAAGGLLLGNLALTAAFYGLLGVVLGPSDSGSLRVRTAGPAPEVAGALERARAAVP